MRDLTPQEHRDLDRRVCQVLRQLQLYDERGGVDGAFAQDAAMLSGFIRGEIREAMHHAAQRAERPEQAPQGVPYVPRAGDIVRGRGFDRGTVYKLLPGQQCYVSTVGGTNLFDWSDIEPLPADTTKPEEPGT
jgi:hypothetical protein